MDSYARALIESRSRDRSLSATGRAAGIANMSRKLEQARRQLPPWAELMALSERLDGVDLTDLVEAFARDADVRLSPRMSTTTRELVAVVDVLDAADQRWVLQTVMQVLARPSSDRAS